MRFPHEVQVGQKIGVLGMVGADLAFIEEGAGGADLDALAAASATGRAPVLMQVGDDGAVDSSAHNVPNVRAFDLGADTNAAGAEDAAVVVEGEALVRGIDGELRVAIGQPYMGETLLLGESLELAVAIGDADRADVVALGKEKFEDVAAIFLKAFGIGEHLHAFEDGGDTGWQQLGGAGDLNHADAACADITEAVEMAEGGYFDVVLASDFEDGLPAAAADFVAVDGESFDVDGVVHATTSWPAFW